MKVDEEFSGTDFTKTPLDVEYENCIFKSCNFAEADLSKISFLECEFSECNLTLAQIDSSAFKDVVFHSCKMLGLKFDRVNQFLLQLKFENCHLGESSFYNVNLKNSSFSSCNLQGVDFTEALLKESSLIDSNLSGATFENTNLTEADLSGSYNFNIDPEINTIYRARFSNDQLAGLLSRYHLEITS